MSHDPIESVVKAIEELSAEVHVLGDILEELRTELIHELRNRYSETLDGVPVGEQEEAKKPSTLFPLE